MKSRIGVMVGVIEKVGVIPALVSSLLAIYKFCESEARGFGLIDWIAVTLIGLYFISVTFYIVAQKLDRYSLIAETALKMKLEGNLE